MLPKRLARAAVTFALTAFACGGDQRPGGRHPGAGGAAVAERRSDDRPALLLVARSGDPVAALGFAAVLEGGAEISAATAAFVAARLRERGFTDVRTRAHGLGFTLDTHVANASETQRFVEAVSAVLDAPVRAREPGLDAAQAALVGLGTRLPGPATAAVADCSASLAVRAERPPWDAARLPTALGEALASVRTVERAAFAAVGAAEILRTAESALAGTGDWERGSPPTDPWPERGSTGADLAGLEPRRLSVAVRLGNPGAALGAADALGDTRGTLARRLESLRPPWRLERVSATARPRGACLRVDAAPPAGDPGPNGDEVVRAISLVSDEIDRELAERRQAPADAVLAEALLRPIDPGEAAAAAAWRGLVHRLPAGPARRFIAYAGPGADRSEVDLARGLTALRGPRARTGIETRVRSEPGQARFWALVASSCGTATEALADAGEAASVVSTLSLVRRSRDGVMFEPWIAPDGVGVLAHALRRSPRETPADQARRVAAALGELLATARPGPTARLAAHDELIDALGRYPRPGYALTLEALSGGHPSWLEPRGSVTALGSAESRSFDAALSHWLRSPLRLAVLANADQRQGDTARQELERWLAPVRGEPSRCPAPARVTPRTGELSIATTAGNVTEGAYVGLPLPRFEGRLPVEARATVFLLSRPGGWLERALTDLPATASATALGGPRAAALVVQIAAPPEHRDAAVARVRSLFDRFATSAPAASEVALAERELRRDDLLERRDPRRRVVELWRGATSAPRLDAARLARYQAELGRAGRLVVWVESG